MTKFLNKNPDMPWNDPVEVMDPTAAWNQLDLKDDPYAPWNDPNATPEDYEAYKREIGWWE